MANRRLSLNTEGELTYCTASEENIGKGRCNHIDHQRKGETQEQFMERTEDLRFKMNEVPDDPNGKLPPRKLALAVEEIHQEKYKFNWGQSSDEYLEDIADLFNEQMNVTFGENEYESKAMYPVKTGVDTDWDAPIVSYDFEKLIGDEKFILGEGNGYKLTEKIRNRRLKTDREVPGVEAFETEEEEQYYWEGRGFKNGEVPILTPEPYLTRLDTQMIIPDVPDDRKEGVYHNYALEYLFNHPEDGPNLHHAIEPEGDGLIIYDDTMSTDEGRPDQVGNMKRWLESTQLTFQALNQTEIKVGWDDKRPITRDEKVNLVARSFNSVLYGYRKHEDEAGEGRDIYFQRDENGSIDFDTMFAPNAIPKDMWGELTEYIDENFAERYRIKKESTDPENEKTFRFKRPFW